MKILILRFSSIGDIVLTSPVPRCLKKQLGAEIHFLTKASFAPILESNPYIDKVIAFEKEITADTVEWLATQQYDHIVDLHHNLRSLGLKLKLRGSSRAFAKLNWEKWLLVNFKIDRMPDVHIVQRYMDTVRPLGVEYDGEGLDYFIPSDKREQIELPAPPFIAFSMGATHATKRLPEEKIAAICKKLSKPVVLLGGKSESAVGVRIAERVGERVINLCNQLSLHGSASVLLQAEKVITHDTGLMHIAAALRRPVISVWGSTVPKFGMWPLYPTGMDLNTSIEVTRLSCRPCSKIGFDKCPKGHFRCMQDIDIERIVSLANA